jgi:hypothetical protein
MDPKRKTHFQSPRHHSKPGDCGEKSRHWGTDHPHRFHHLQALLQRINFRALGVIFPERVPRLKELEGKHWNAVISLWVK